MQVIEDLQFEKFNLMQLMFTNRWQFHLFHSNVRPKYFRVTLEDDQVAIKFVLVDKNFAISVAENFKIMRLLNFLFTAKEKTEEENIFSSPTTSTVLIMLKWYSSSNVVSRY